MPEYTVVNDRPDRNTIYDWAVGEEIPDRYDVTHDDGGAHPQIGVDMTGTGLDDIRIADQRTREGGSDVVLGRIAHSVANVIENSNEEFSTITEAARWLTETLKQWFEYRQGENTIAQDLNAQVTLHN